MPFPLTANLAASDRKALAAFGALLLLCFLLALVFGSGSASSAEGFGLPSTYSYGPGGGRAAFQLLKEMGYTVERWEKSPLELPSRGEGTVLVLAQPVYPAGEDERQALKRFVRTGGRILATGAYMASRFLPEGAASPQEAWPGDTRAFRPRLASPITLGAEEIEMEPSGYWSSGAPSHLELYGERRQAVVVTYRVGEGRVVWWADAWPLRNIGLTLRQNLALFLNSIGPPHGVRVLWDEYFHGERGSLWAYLRTTPVPWAGAQLLLVVLALVVTFGRRWGPVRPLHQASRLSPLEFVDTLGGLYERAHAAAPAVGVALQRFRFLLTRRLALPAGCPAAELGRAARARLGAAAEGLGDLVARAELAAASQQLGDSQALDLVQALDRFQEALQLKPGARPFALSSRAAGKETS
jgi:hypothetical protein